MLWYHLSGVSGTSSFMASGSTPCACWGVSWTGSNSGQQRSLPAGSASSALFSAPAGELLLPGAVCGSGLS